MNIFKLTHRSNCLRKFCTNYKYNYKNSTQILASRKYSSQQPEQTALYDFHVENGGKMVNFAGFALPVQYTDLSLVDSHLQTRQIGSIFDVSHMLQTYVRGKAAIAALESVTTADLQSLPNGAGTLTVFTNTDGGILDDLIVTKVTPDLLYVVSNAAMRTQDIQIMEQAVAAQKANGNDVTIEFLTPSDQSLIAVQGPQAVAALSKLLPVAFDAKKFYFMNTAVVNVAGVNGCRVTRCGYTGEDGVEISAPSGKIRHITEALLNVTDGIGKLKMAGLGARDTLRIEAGLCLYGSDIDAKATPIEAGLAWLVAKRRRTARDFPGAERINQELANGVSRRRVGLKMSSETKIPPARSGAKILKDDIEIGHVTSGCPSPSLRYNIAMGYIAENCKASGTDVMLKVRDKVYAAQVVKMPFLKTNYYLNK